MEPGFWIKYALVLGVVGFVLYALYAIVRRVSRGRLLSASDRHLIGVVESAFV